MEFEFSNLEGRIQQIENLHINDIPSIADIKAIYHPAQEFFYKDEKVLYQVWEFTRLIESFVVVIGYRKSEDYFDGEKRKVRIETVKEEDKKEITGLVKKLTDSSLEVKFFDIKNEY